MLKCVVVSYFLFLFFYFLGSSRYSILSSAANHARTTDTEIWISCIYKHEPTNQQQHTHTNNNKRKHKHHQRHPRDNHERKKKILPKVLVDTSIYSPFILKDLPIVNLFNDYKNLQSNHVLIL